MGVSPIEMSQMFTRTQDISPIKQHEDAKPMLDQNAFQQQLEKQVQEHSRKVIDPNKSSNTKYDYDAKKKGKWRIFRKWRKTEAVREGKERRR